MKTFRFSRYGMTLLLHAMKDQRESLRGKILANDFDVESRKLIRTLKRLTRESFRYAQREFKITLK